MWSDLVKDLTREVPMPLWALGALWLFAILALFDRLLVPSVRWTLHRQANRTIDRLNQRLKLRIQPFKLTARRLLIDRLVYDPEVIAAVDQQARVTGVPREVVVQLAGQYAREIVPSFSAYAYFGVGTRLARRVSNALYRVRLGTMDDAALSAVPPESSVVFVINHRSNMDYILVTYVAATASALSYAVGEWAQIWGLRGLIRSMGAYFIRRNSRDPLYRRVLARYVDMSTKAGVVQAIFPEGGLTRDGLLRPPKLGLLSYMVSGFDPNGTKDIVFIPVGLNYDRVLEDRVQTGAIDTAPGEQPRFRFSIFVMLKFIARRMWQRLRGQWHRYGYACVSFGRPISLKSVLAPRALDLRTMPADERQAEIEVLGQRLIDEVGKIVPALPVPLVATVMREAHEPLTLFELKGRVYTLITALENGGAYVHIPRHDRDYAIEVGLRMLAERKLIVAQNGTYALNPAEAVLLAYYANSIAHLKRA